MSAIVTVLLAALVALYLVASILLSVFGANLIWFSIVAWRNRRRSDDDPGPDDRGSLPRVTVQLPIYNELYVARRVVEACCALDYPRDRLQIQVLDDSTDETSEVIDEVVTAARADGIDIEHLRRPDRQGYKAGALEAGRLRASGELIAVFDADFVPPAGFLRRTVDRFVDPGLAFVQARWGHLNGRFSWLTRLQVPAIDGHFLVEQRARGIRGRWFNFNGTAGIWRAEAIEDAGGWRADTLTEDLDLSYRAHLRGWHGVFLQDLVVPGELPARLTSFRRQQHRWARGSLECAAKLLPEIWRSDASLATRFQATLHLTAYAVHLLLMVVVLTYPAVVLAPERLPTIAPWYGLGLAFSTVAVAPTVFVTTGQLIGTEGRPRKTLRCLPAIAAVVVFGSGLMVNTTRAAIDIVRHPSPRFERTAKFGLSSTDAIRSTRWATARYHERLDRIVFAELLLGGYAASTAALAVVHGSWVVAFYAALFATGISSVAVASIGQSLRVHRRRAVAPEPADDPAADPVDPDADPGAPADTAVGASVGETRLVSPLPQ